MKKLLLLMIIITTLISCRKEVTKESSNYDSIISQNYRWDSTITKVSKHVANLLKNKNFREYLKSEVLKKFDGDYDVLVSKIIYDYNSRKLITLNSNTENQDWPTDAISYLQQASNSYPLLQLSVQIDPSAWNTSFIPNVVFISSEYNEDISDFITGFDPNGNAIVMNARIDPIMPVVIVGGNERGYIDASQNFYLFDSHIGDYTNSGNQVDSLSPINPNSPIMWYRQNFKYESIFEIRYDDIGSVEGWPAGAPETRVFTNTVDPNDPTKYVQSYKGQFEPSRRRHINGKWWDCGVTQMHLWRWQNTGTVFKYSFYEYDYSPISQEQMKQLGRLTGNLLDSLVNINLPVNLGNGIRTIFDITAIFMPMQNHKSEFLGEMDISANNNATEFSVPTGQFKFRSKPF